MDMNRTILDALLGALLLKEDDLGADDRVTFYADGTAELEQNGRTMRFGEQQAIRDEMKSMGLTSLLIKRRGQRLSAYVAGRPVWNS